MLNHLSSFLLYSHILTNKFPSSHLDNISALKQAHKKRSNIIIILFRWHYKQCHVWLSFAAAAVVLPSYTKLFLSKEFFSLSFDCTLQNSLALVFLHNLSLLSLRFPEYYSFWASNTSVKIKIHKIHTKMFNGCRFFITASFFMAEQIPFSARAVWSVQMYV